MNRTLGTNRLSFNCQRVNSLDIRQTDSRWYWELGIYRMTKLEYWIQKSFFSVWSQVQSFWSLQKLFNTYPCKMHNNFSTYVIIWLIHAKKISSHYCTLIVLVALIERILLIDRRLLHRGRPKLKKKTTVYNPRDRMNIFYISIAFVTALLK